MSIIVSLDEFAFKAMRRKQNIPYIESSKGYPAMRDPAAEYHSGVLQGDLDEASLHKLRLHYGPAVFIQP